MNEQKVLDGLKELASGLRNPSFKDLSENLIEVGYERDLNDLDEAIFALRDTIVAQQAAEQAAEAAVGVRAQGPDAALTAAAATNAAVKHGLLKAHWVIVHAMKSLSIMPDSASDTANLKALVEPLDMIIAEYVNQAASSTGESASNQSADPNVHGALETTALSMTQLHATAAKYIHGFWGPEYRDSYAESLWDPCVPEGGTLSPLDARPSVEEDGASAAAAEIHGNPAAGSGSVQAEARASERDEVIRFDAPGAPSSDEHQMPQAAAAAAIEDNLSNWEEPGGQNADAAFGGDLGAVVNVDLIGVLASMSIASGDSFA